MVQHGKEIYKVLEDLAVVDGAALFGSGLMDRRCSKVVSGGIWAARWSMDLRWTVDLDLDRAFLHLFRSGLHHFISDFFKKKYQNSNQ
jgi:hypothetical protein